MSRSGLLASCDIDVTFTGVQAHAASDPWMGSNALDALILLFTSIGLWRQQLRPDARVHGIVLEGGTAANIIPSRTTARFMIRSTDEARFREMGEHFRALVQAAALATGTTGEAVFSGGSSTDEAQPDAGRRFWAQHGGRGHRGPRPRSDAARLVRHGQRQPGAADDPSGLAICDEGVPGHSTDFRDLAAQPRADEVTLARGDARRADRVGPVRRSVARRRRVARVPRRGHVTDDATADPAAAAELARYYDLDLTDDPGDLELYQALAARTGGPVLELAAGSGRIAAALAASGLDVVGLDLDPAMLARAEEPRAARDGRTTAQRQPRSSTQADPPRRRLGARSGSDPAAQQPAAARDAEHQAGAFGPMAAHLRPDGLAVVDVWLPGAGRPGALRRPARPRMDPRRPGAR